MNIYLVRIFGKKMFLLSSTYTREKTIVFSVKEFQNEFAERKVTKQKWKLSKKAHEFPRVTRQQKRKNSTWFSNWWNRRWPLLFWQFFDVFLFKKEFSDKVKTYLGRLIQSKSLLLIHNFKILQDQVWNKNSRDLLWKIHQFYIKISNLYQNQKKLDHQLKNNHFSLD